MQLAAIVDDKVRMLGEKIPASLLNENCPTPYVTFYDFPTEVITRTLARFKQLIMS